MIETLIREYLNRALSVPVYLEHPEPEPDVYLLMERTGGSRTDHVDGATIAIQSYASSLYEAASLNEQVKAAFETMLAETWLAGARLNSDYNFTDPTTKRYRYQAVYDVNY